MKTYLTLLLFFVLIFACKKEDTAKTTYSPCVVERGYQFNTIAYGPSQLHPQAKVRLLFSNIPNSSNPIEYGFNKYPTTGRYNMVSYIDTLNPALPNQMAFVRDSGSFHARSGQSDSAQVFLQVSNTGIRITYCEISDGHFYFDNVTQEYIGISPISDNLFMPM